MMPSSQIRGETCAQVRETVATTPSFREPFKSQRCLVPADGFYEWQQNGKTKQPYCFEVNDGELFAFAGLWDRWRGPQGEVVESCSILTTTPNSLLTDIHDRMPVILSPDNYDLWLDPAFRETRSISDAKTIRPYTDEAISREHESQSRRERRCRLCETIGIRPVTGSELIVLNAQELGFPFILLLADVRRALFEIGDQSSP